MQNVRYANRNLRVKNRNRLRAMGCECGICKGKLGEIHYDEPSDYKHPLSFVVDEIIPISKYYLGNYTSPREAAEDFNNLQAAHYICNSMKSNKVGFNLEQKSNYCVSDGEW